VEKHVKDISEIIKAMDYLIPAQPAIDGETPLSEDEAFLLLLPRLYRLKKRGADFQEVADFLAAMGFPVKARTLRRRLEEYQAVQEKIAARQTEREAAAKAASEKRKSRKKKAADEPAATPGPEHDATDRPPARIAKTEADHA
jgi:hypothetical protein